MSAVVKDLIECLQLDKITATMGAMLGETPTKIEEEDYTY